MGISFKVKLDGLAAKRKLIAALPRELAASSADLATEAARLADESYGRRQDPHGGAWAPRKGGGGHPLLEKSGRLRGSLRGVALARGFRLTFGAAYGVYHQNGTSRMSRRAILPYRGLPGAWRSALGALLVKRLRAALRGR
jgi:phage gpG-like protein